MNGGRDEGGSPVERVRSSGLGRPRVTDVNRASGGHTFAEAIASLLQQETRGGGSPLRVMAESLPLIVWHVGPDRRFRSAFGRGMERLGLLDGDLDGMEFRLLDPSGRDIWERAHSGGTTLVDMQGESSRGLWSFTNVIVPHPDGGLLGVAIDRTERFLAQRALEESETRFRLLADNAPVGIFVTDHRGFVTYANRFLGEMFGVRDVADVRRLARGGWVDLVHPDDRETVVDVTGRVAAGEATPEVEVRLILPGSGTRWLSVSVAPFVDTGGTVSGAIGTVQDITERRGVFEEMARREQRFRRLAESAPVGIVLMDPAGAVLYLNPRVRSILGKGGDALGGKGWLEVVHPADREVLEDLVRALLRDHRPFDAEVRVTRGDGVERTISIHASPLMDERGDTSGGVATLFDVTDLRDAERRVRESEAMNRAVLEYATDGIVTVDLHGRILVFNRAAERMTGWSYSEMLGEPVERILPEPVRSRLVDDLAAVAAGGRSVLAGRPPVEVSLVRRDATTTPVELSITHVEVEGRHMVTLFMRDVSERKAFELELERQATHDPLTSLPNRALLAAQLENALARGYRNGKSVAVLFVSLDRMNIVTDSLGHRAGDELRVAAAHRLLGVARPSDTVTRFGENEFVVISEDLDDVSEAVEIAERIIEALSVPFDLTVDEAYVVANVGIAFAVDGLGTAESLISDADVAMYRAREKGGGRYEIFDSDMRAWVNNRRKTENALRHGLDRGEFRLHYQPIVEVETGAVKGFEALVRWERPHYGLVPPGEFVPVAEECGLIVPLGRWILEEACRQLRAWQDRHPDRGLTVSVNLSARQLAQRDIADVVAEVLYETGADPSRLTLELTESILLDDVDQAGRILTSLRDIGVTLAIDDFGTGYSSLTYLRTFPFDAVKIDRGFVSQLGTDSRDASIVETIVMLSHGLGLHCVAEGVETEVQLRALRDLNCRFAQGFLFARPLSANTIDLLLRNGAIRPGARLGEDEP